MRKQPVGVEGRHWTYRTDDEAIEQLKNKKRVINASLIERVSPLLSFFSF